MTARFEPLRVGAQPSDSRQDRPNWATPRTSRWKRAARQFWWLSTDDSANLRVRAAVEYLLVDSIDPYPTRPACAGKVGVIIAFPEFGS
jgi:hypothetical protein